MIANEIGLYPDREAEIVAGIEDWRIWVMKLSMMILPLVCILVGFVLYQKKFKIDEEFYATIVSDLEARNATDSSENLTETKTEKV